MYCTDCELNVAYDEKKTKDICECVVCGGVLQDTAYDILKKKKHGIVSEVREDQIRMAREIEKIFKDTYDQKILIAEGGTGIGKSFAYLIPAILQHKDKRVVISTATKALQEQVFNDLKMLCETLGVDIPIDLIKGAGNYGCLKVDKVGKHIENEREKSLYKERVKKCIEDKTWIDFSTGDPYPTVPKWADAVSAAHCPTGGRNNCSLKCRPNPTEGRIIVVNHHMLAMDLVFSNPDNGKYILGPYTVLIVDEAHELVEGLRSALTSTVSASSMHKAGNLLRTSDELVMVVKLVSRGVVADWRNAYAGAEYMVARALDMLEPRAEDGTNIVDMTEPETQEGLALLKEASQKISGIFTELEQCRKIGYHKKFTGQLKAGYDDVCAQTSKLRSMVGNLRGLDDENNLVTLVRDPRTNKLVLSQRPIDIDKIVGERLSAIPHAVYTSATLSVGNRGFEYFKTGLGILEKAPELVEANYESPFNYKDNALLFVPFDMIKPPPSGDKAYGKWIQAVHEHSSSLINIFQGDTLILCTSNAIMNELYRSLTAKFAGTGITILRQQQGAANYAMDQYLKTPNSVLIGVKTFWQGVNVKGDKLRLVIIPKIQFPHYNDPIISIKQKRSGKKWDHDLQIPPMITSLKQAVGRLIRTKDDYGVVAILDPRVIGGTRLSASKNVFKAGPPGGQKLRLSHLLKCYGRTVYDALPIKNIYLRETAFTVLRNFVKGHKERRTSSEKSD